MVYYIIIIYCSQPGKKIISLLREQNLGWAAHTERVG